MNKVTAGNWIAIMLCNLLLLIPGGIFALITTNIVAYLVYAVAAAVLLMVLNVSFSIKHNIKCFVPSWLMMVVSAVLTYFLQYNIVYYVSDVSDKNIMVTVVAVWLILALITVASVVVQIVLGVRAKKQA